MSLISGSTFKRGQVEWALWRLFTLTRYLTTPPISSVFRTRIKRLLELDRASDPLMSAEEVHLPHAFFASLPEGTGIDTQYTAFDAFCLVVALDLLDAGYKQSEVVLLLRHLRPRLEKPFRKMQKAPVILRQRRVPADDRPGCPAYEKNGRRYADCRVFVLIEKIEFKEVFPGAEDGLPVIFEPIFCRGLAELNKQLDRMNHQRRKLLVLELADTASLLLQSLREAPAVKRGRK